VRGGRHRWGWGRVGGSVVGGEALTAWRRLGGLCEKAVGAGIRLRELWGLLAKAGRLRLKLWLGGVGVGACGACERRLARRRRRLLGGEREERGLRLLETLVGARGAVVGLWTRLGR
jgi:hypothetical protein